jgi:hypothetical protein
MSQAVKYQQDYGCATYNHFSGVFVALKHSTALSSEETNAVHKYGQQPHNSAEHTQKATWLGGSYINTHFSMSYTVNTTTGASSTKNYADMDLPGQGELHLSHCTVARAFDVHGEF